MNQLLASESDLFVVGVSAKKHQQQVLRCVVVAFSIGVLGLAISAISVNFEETALVLMFTGAGAYLIATRPCRKVHGYAEEIRRQLELSTAVFLDLVNVLLAGGAGIETSVVAAANAGDGAGFSMIRLAVMRAQSARMSYWDSLAEVGIAADVPTLVEIAHTVQLAGQHGARIRTSLAAKAIALRKHNLAQVEHDEAQRTEKIGLPLVILFLGFLMLVGYPAFSQTISSF